MFLEVFLLLLKKYSTRIIRASEFVFIFYINEIGTLLWVLCLVMLSRLACLYKVTIKFTVKINTDKNPIFLLWCDYFFSLKAIFKQRVHLLPDLPTKYKLQCHLRMRTHDLCINKNYWMLYRWNIFILSILKVINQKELQKLNN